MNVNNSTDKFDTRYLCYVTVIYYITVLSPVKTKNYGTDPVQSHLRPELAPVHICIYPEKKYNIYEKHQDIVVITRPMSRNSSFLLLFIRKYIGPVFAKPLPFFISKKLGHREEKRSR